MNLKKNNITSSPAVINGHSRSNQPAMWRNNFKRVFKAEVFLYEENILDDVNIKIKNASSSFEGFELFEINNAIFKMNTNESYDRHYHWKNLHLEAHAAKLCLNNVFNNWSQAVLNNTT